MASFIIQILEIVNYMQIFFYLYFMFYNQYVALNFLQNKGLNNVINETLISNETFFQHNKKWL